MPVYLKVIRRRAARLALTAVASAACLLSVAAAAHSTQRRAADPPITKQGLLESLRNVAALSPAAKTYARQRMLEEIRQRGVDFRLSAADERQLRVAGAPPAVVAAVRDNYRPAVVEARSSPTPRPVPVASPSPPASSSTGRPRVVGDAGRPAPPGVGAAAETKPGVPLTKAQVVTLLRRRTTAASVARSVEANGVDFKLTPEIRREIAAAGGGRTLLHAIERRYVAPAPEAVAAATPTPAPAPAATPTPPPSVELPPLPPRGVAPAPLVRGRSGDGYLALRAQTLTPEAADVHGVVRGRGVLVEYVRPGGTAERAGLRAGDVLTAVNGRAVDDEEQFWSSIRALRPGSLATLNVWRAGRAERVGADITDFPAHLELAREAAAALRRASADEAVRLLRQALDQDPSDADLYRQLFAALLYHKADARAARDVAARVVEAGGRLSFRVRHDHGGGALYQSCLGDLVVASDAVAFVADDRAHSFRAPRAELRPAKLAVRSQGDSFTVETAGRAAPDLFTTVLPPTAAGGAKFAAAEPDPARRPHLFAHEARIIVQTINHALQR